MRVCLFFCLAGLLYREAQCGKHRCDSGQHDVDKHAPLVLAVVCHNCLVFCCLEVVVSLLKISKNKYSFNPKYPTFPEKIINEELMDNS